MYSSSGDHDFHPYSRGIADYDATASSICRITYKRRRAIYIQWFCSIVVIGQFAFTNETCSILARVEGSISA